MVEEIGRGRPRYLCVYCSVRYLSLVGDFLARHDLTALRLVRGDSRSSPWGLNGDLAEDEHSTAFSLPLPQPPDNFRPALSRGRASKPQFYLDPRFQLAFRGVCRLRLGFVIRVTGSFELANASPNKTTKARRLDFVVGITTLPSQLASTTLSRTNAASSPPPIPHPISVYRHRHRAHPTHSQTRRLPAHSPALPAQTVHQSRRARVLPALSSYCSKRFHERQRVVWRRGREAAEGRRGGEILGWAVGCERGCCEGLLVAEAYV